MADDLRKNLLLTDFAADEEGPGNKHAAKQHGKEKIKVYLRIRPSIAGEEPSECIEVVDSQTVVMHPPKESFTLKSTIRGIDSHTHQFSFSSVFGPGTSQSEFFNATLLDSIKDLMKGNNCLVFTYGVTNAGKTHTIQGTTKDGGILPRAFDVIFNTIVNKEYPRCDLKPACFYDVTKLSPEEQNRAGVFRNYLFQYGNKESFDLSALLRMDSTMNTTRSDISGYSASMSESVASSKVDDHSQEDQRLAAALESRVADQTILDLNDNGSVQYSIWVSYAEIYKEYVYDLLTPIESLGPKRRVALKLTEDKDGNPYIKGLREVNVKCTNEAYKILSFGRRNQRFSATKMNENSSRSHCIFTIKVIRVISGGEQVAKLSRLSFVDLAGSERQDKTNNTGHLLKEANNINKSLMTLGKCIDCIRYNQLHRNHPIIIPFRESKLTRLFQTCFLGKAKACMIVNASQSVVAFDETYHVMKFSAVAKQVVARPTTSTLEQPGLVISSRPRPKQLPITGSPSVSIEEEYTFDEVIFLVQQLQRDLKAEKLQKQALEANMREQVFRQMKDAVQAMQQDYTETWEEEKANMEDNFEKRLELLTKTITKTRKKRRLDDGEEEEMVALQLLTVEEEKVKKLEEENRSLAIKLKGLQNIARVMTPQKVDAGMPAAEAELNEAKETLQVQGTQLEHLQITLSNANELLEDKELEIEKLKEALNGDEQQDVEEGKLVDELQHLLAVSTEELNVARVKLDARDRVIAQMQMPVAPPVTALLPETQCCTCKAEMIAMTRQRDDMQHTLKESEEEKQKMEFEKDELQIKMERCERLLEEHKAVLQDNESFIEQLNKENALYKQQSETAHHNELKPDVKSTIPKHIAKATPKRITPSRSGTPLRSATPIKGSTSGVGGAGGSVQRAASIQMITQLEKALADSNHLVESKERDISAKAKALTAKEDTIKVMQAQSTTSAQQAAQHMSQIGQLELTVTTLQGEVESAKECLRKSQLDFTSSRDQFKEELRLQELSVNELKSHLTEVEKREKELVTEQAQLLLSAETTRKALEKELEGVKNDNEALSEQQRKLSMEKNMCESNNARLEAEIKEVQSRKSFNNIQDKATMKEELDTAYSQIAALNRERDDLCDKITHLQKREAQQTVHCQDDSTPQVNRLTSELLSVKSQLKSAEREKATLQLEAARVSKEVTLRDVDKSRYEARIEEQQKLVSHYESLLKNHQIQSDCSEDDKSAMAEEKQQLHAEIGRQKETIEDKIHECKTLAAEMRRLTSQNNTLLAEKCTLEETVEKLVENRGNLSDWIEDDLGDGERSRPGNKQSLAAKEKQIQDLTMAKNKALHAMRESHDLVRMKSEQLEEQVRQKEQAEKSYMELLGQVQSGEKTLEAPATKKVRKPSCNDDDVNHRGNTSTSRRKMPKENSEDVLREIDNSSSFVTPQPRVMTRSRARGTSSASKQQRDCFASPCMTMADVQSSHEKSKQPCSATRAGESSAPCEKSQSKDVPVLQPRKRGRQKLYNPKLTLAYPDADATLSTSLSSKNSVLLQQAAVLLEKSATRGKAK